MASKDISFKIFYVVGFYCISPKLAKGSWTHFPDIPSMLFTVERLSATSALVKQV